MLNTLFKHLLLSVFFIVTFLSTAVVFAYPVTFIDSQGQNITIAERPQRVVSLVPSITETILRLGAQDAVTAITYHSTYPPQTAGKQTVGGFFTPNLDLVAQLKPDVIFYSSLQKGVRQRFGKENIQLIALEPHSLDDAFENILLLGDIFDRKEDAVSLVKKNQAELRLIAAKVAKIPAEKRKRVMRVMCSDSIMTPGEDSFQNELIAAAGGITPHFGKQGNVVEVTEDEWMNYNPQVLYGCGNDKATAIELLTQLGWKDVSAVADKCFFSYPCELTCRAATNIGYFVKWLSANIYEEEFSDTDNLVLETGVTRTRHIDLELPYVKDARVAYSNINDFGYKSLIIDFEQPMTVVSTLEGQRSGIMTVGNNYTPPACWNMLHKKGFKVSRTEIYDAIDVSQETGCFLFTGADMDNLAVKSEKYREMEVFALVTAGVEHNALRMSKDLGGYYEPGTINVIIMTNMQLAPRAMTRAIISATEAKTAALMDMDIRSSYSAQIHKATGTGTDNVLVVQGTGTLIENAGGHTKMGEMISKAVYAGVREAVYKQNGIIGERTVFRRLKERKISPHSLVVSETCENGMTRKERIAALEDLLLQSRYANFIEAAFTISDDYEKGLVSDLGAFDMWCNAIAQEIAGQPIGPMTDLIELGGLPVVLHKALNSLMNGICFQAH
ncbi:MAG: adenosylcobinamide amidohydrolase [Desulfobacteraceae bacterium 4572_123]|nr:MAG: adenosylcobinamide amidohydrolase [Desulfobacteraceae bacterium 4572_123]